MALRKHCILYASSSARVLSCTQGMLRSAVLGQFYLDLQDPLYKTPFAIYHRRYSTNTTPKWPLAQPMRCLGHNGALLPVLTAAALFPRRRPPC